MAQTYGNCLLTCTVGPDAMHHISLVIIPCMLEIESSHTVYDLPKPIYRSVFPLVISVFLMLDSSDCHKKPYVQ